MKSPLFRPLSTLVDVSYITVVRHDWVYFTRKCYTYATCCAPQSMAQADFICHHPSVCEISVSEIKPNDMAPRLPPSKLHLIRDMIECQSFTTSQMAEEAECTKVTIINIRRNLRQFGTIYAPQTRIGRKRTMTPLMINALCDHLSEKPGLYLDEMAVFLWDEF